MKQYMKIKFYFLLFLVFCILSSCERYDSKILEKYGAEKDSLNVAEIEYKDFKGKNFNNSIVLVLREDCEYCHKLVSDLFSEELTLTNNSNPIYVLESSKMSLTEKEDILDKYSVSVVPTILIFEKNKLKSLEVGTLSKEQKEKIINFIK